MSVHEWASQTFNELQRKFDMKTIRRRLIDPRIRPDYEPIAFGRYVGIPFSSWFITVMMHQRDATDLPLSSFVFLVNMLNSSEYDGPMSFLQIALCALVRLSFHRVESETLVVFAYSCASLDSSILVSAQKMIVLTSLDQWRVALFAFLLMVFPMAGLGYRAVLYNHTKTSRKRLFSLIFTSKMNLDGEVALFFWLLPFGFMLAIAPPSPLYNRVYWSYIFSAGLVCLALFVNSFRDKVNGYLTQATDVRVKYADAKQLKVDFEGFRKVNLNFRMLVGFASGGFFNVLFANGEYLLGIPFVVLFCLAVGDFSFPRYVINSRSVLVCQFLATLFIRIRATCAFPSETLSGFVSDGALVCAVLVHFSRFPLAITFLFFVSVASFFLEVFTRSGSLKIILKSREGQNFLDHAIKQKFAGTGTALDIALADDNIRRNLSPDTIRVMQVAQKECQLGSFLCHEATLKRQILDGTIVIKPTARQLGSVIDEWRENWKEMEISVAPTDAQQYLSTDWILVFQIIQAIYCRGQHDSQSFFARTTVTVTSTFKLVVYVHMVSPGHYAAVRQTCELFAECLKGTFSYHHGRCKLSIPVKISKPLVAENTSGRYTEATPSAGNIARERRISRKSQEEARLSPISVPGGTEGGGDALPQNLVYAVLDDSAMIRVNLRITLLKALHASPASIFYGETEEQANEFIQMCMRLRPDICILDENLDYTAVGGSLILGSSVAEELRGAGYNGLLVMHSANELLRDSLDYSIVDGFIIKGANKVRMKNELAQLLHQHRAQRMEQE